MKTISVKKQSILRKVFGAGDLNIKLIKKEFGVEIVNRGGKIKIIGDDKNVENAFNLINEVIVIAQSRDYVSVEDVNALIKIEDDYNEIKVNGKEYFGKENFTAQSKGQKAYIESIAKYDIVFSIGPAGTGKSYLAVACAIRALKSGLVKKIVLTRPAVEAGERLGYLPGDYYAKINPYLRPLYDAINNFLEIGQLKKLIDNEIIEIVPLAYMRGRTLNDAFIILDEAQNTTIEQMKMFLTRMGKNSKIVVTGDITQIDLINSKHSGLIEVQKFLKNIPEIQFVYLDKKDIVRHPVVQKLVDAFYEYERKKGKK